MDFTNRNASNRAPAPQETAVQSAPPERKSQPRRERGKWLKIGTLVLLYGATVIIVALAFFFSYNDNPDQEGKFINKNEMQAVFVNVNGTNGGQVYFGHVQGLTDDYIRLTNVFYIQNQNTTAATASSYNLVKLGCELHGPEDEMIINRSQVFFWENLKNSSQVAQKAAQYYKSNPNGQQNCSQTNASAGTTQQPATTDSSAAAQSTTPSTSAPAATGTTNTSTTKKQ